jgi:phosphatidylserine/phosphatidylglycerophosphate/cardiolipin synthase-like enzyme
MEFLVSYFTQHFNDLDRIEVDERVISEIKKMNLSSRTELYHRLFEMAQLNVAEVESAELLNWMYNCFLIIKKYGFRFHNVYFSPGHDIKKTISQILYDAEYSVDLCVFTITDPDLSNHIYNCQHRGVKVRIITDNEKSSARGSAIWEMAQSGILVKTDRSRFLMHNKFGIIDEKIAITGSFNWTLTATLHNQENLLATSNVDIVNQYQHEFNRLWQKMFELTDID